MKRNQRKELIAAGFEFQKDEKYGEIIVKDNVAIPVMAVEGMPIEQILELAKPTKENSGNVLAIGETEIRGSIKEGAKLIDKLDCFHYISIYIKGSGAECTVSSQLMQVPEPITDRDSIAEVLHKIPAYRNEGILEISRIVACNNELIIYSWPSFVDIYKQPFGCAYMRLLYEAYSKFDYDSIILTVVDEESESIVGLNVYQKGMTKPEDVFEDLCAKVEEIAPRINTKRIHCVCFNKDSGKLTTATLDRKHKTLTEDLLANKPIAENLLLIAKQDDGDYYVISDLSIGLSCTESELEKLRCICMPLKNELSFGNKVVVINTGLNYDFYDEINLYD